MTRRDKIDGVTIEADENGFHLVLSGEEAEYSFLLPGSIAEELMRAVRMEIEPWVREMEAARSEYVVAIRENGSYRVETDEDAYDPTDPKHPTYHERFSAIWDEREGK